MKNNLSIFNNLRPITVGFDNMFDHFEHMLDDGGFFRNGTVSNFPPYNIVKLNEDQFVIEIAAAGFSKKDFSIDLKDLSLRVRAKASEKSKDFIHQGIAARSFERVFALAEHVKVKEATYSDGILAIKLVREIPEAEKPIQIKVK